MKNILVVDVRLIAFKTFYNHSSILNTVQLIVDSAKKYVKPDKVIFAWDSKIGSKKRKEIYPEYKAHRKDKIKSDSEKKRLKQFNKDFNQLENILKYIGNVIHIDGYEADDIANIISERFKDSNYNIFFLSSDVDWGVNLVNDNFYQIHLTKGLMNKNRFTELYNISPSNLLHAQAIMGVEKENIKGVYKLGKGRLYKLFNQMTLSEVINEVQSWVDVGKYGTKLIDGFNSVEELYNFNYNILKPIKFDELSEDEQNLFKEQFSNKVGSYDELVSEAFITYNKPFLLTNEQRKFYKI